MRRTLVLALVTLAACSDASSVMEPAEAANSTLSAQSTAFTTIGGVEYEYGCPDFPCPVMPIVTSHINQNLWFWMPPGTFLKPTIYLYVLRTPVQLRTPAAPVVILPPVITPPPPPGLVGPTKWLGKPTVTGQISCTNFTLTLDSSDGGVWSFVSGQIEYEYGSVNPNTGVFTPNGMNSVVGINASVWNQLLAGIYPLLPPHPNFEYIVHFKANVERSPHTASIEHSFLCHVAPPPAPPAPSLTGPTELHGQRTAGPNTVPLVCSNVLFTLVSPDGGPWTFVSGLRKIEFLSWNATKQKWLPNGNSMTGSLTSSGWNQLLAGTYSLSPGSPSGPYTATFTVTVERGQYQHTLKHSVTCGGPDYFGSGAA